VGINVASVLMPGVADAERWVFKSDCGTESNTEAQKGEASDSFKRACFNWGIGRELYTAPFTWVSSDKCNIKDGRNGSKQCYDKFKVKSITIKDKRITSLEIWNATKNCVAFTWGENNAPKETPPEYVCADCGVVVDANMAARTHKAFGVILCKDCGIKRSEQK
jgi:hypothetical protein